MQQRSKNIYDHSGLTLIELVVVVAILAIMAGMSISALDEYIPDYRLNTAVRELITDLKKAKSEAIKRNVYVVAVFSPGAYSPEGGIGSYMIFVDDGSGNGESKNFIHDGDEEILVTKIMPQNVCKYDASFTTIDSKNDKLLFSSLGLPLIKEQNKFIIGSIYLRNNKGKYYKISISRFGGINLKKSSDGTFS